MSVCCVLFSVLPWGAQGDTGKARPRFPEGQEYNQDTRFWYKWSKIGQQKKVDLRVFSNHPAVHSCGFAGGGLGAWLLALVTCDR